jgi:amidase
MAGVDAADTATHTANGRAESDYAAFAADSELRDLRIGVARKRFTGFQPATDALLEQAVEVLRRLGAEIVDPADLPSADEMHGDGAELTTLFYEFKAGLNAYLQGRGETTDVHTLAELIRFNEVHAEQEMPFFGQESLVKAEEKGPLTDHAYLEALHRKLRLARDEGIDAVMNEHRLDALVAPTHATPWLIDHINGNRYLGGSSSSPAAVAGYPSISVPAGQVSGLPIGVLFFGRAWSEPVLIRIAAAFEAATRHRKPPQFRPTAIP